AGAGQALFLESSTHAGRGARLSRVHPFLRIDMQGRSDCLLFPDGPARNSSRNTSTPLRQWALLPEICRHCATPRVDESFREYRHCPERQRYLNTVPLRKGMPCETTND